MDRTSFREIFGQGNTKITIPPIQRDYAQGRENELAHRARFINTLYNALAGSAPGANLDFIYGSRENGDFEPLDGQQRLTTLFLLHWLVGMREKIPQDKKEFLEKFTYRTRDDTRRFCNLLVRYEDLPTNDDVRKNITDNSAYILEWDNDPSISGMLTMLVDLDRKFYTDGVPNIPDIWEKLDKITFFMEFIEDLGLTDDIYIKMNSRGKPLTEFEHFKTRFDEKTNGSLKNKIDGDWTALMWRYRVEDDRGNPQIDDAFMNCFHFVADLLALKTAGKLAPADHFEMLESIYANPQTSAAYISELENFFKTWSNCSDIGGLFGNYLANGEVDGLINISDTPVNLFKALCQDKTFPLDNKILLHAFTLYLQN